VTLCGTRTCVVASHCGIVCVIPVHVSAGAFQVLDWVLLDSPSQPHFPGSCRTLPNNELPGGSFGCGSLAWHAQQATSRVAFERCVVCGDGVACVVQGMMSEVSLGGEDVRVSPQCCPWVPYAMSLRCSDDDLVCRVGNTPTAQGAHLVVSIGDPITQGEGMSAFTSYKLYVKVRNGVHACACAVAHLSLTCWVWWICLAHVLCCVVLCCVGLGCVAL